MNDVGCLLLLGRILLLIGLLLSLGDAEFVEALVGAGLPQRLRRGRRRKRNQDCAIVYDIKS